MDKPFVRDFAVFGKSQSRRSLDKIGSEGFRTETLPDGRFIRTHGGLPRTYGEEVFEAVSCTYYLESGQLSVGDYAPQSQGRYDSGYWTIPGISPESNWLGGVTSDGAQVHGQTLSNSQVSSALSCQPGHVDGDTTYSYWNDRLRKKKLCVKWTPPSCYTGRMRLFVQAIYGAKYEGVWGYDPIPVGSDTVEIFTPGLRYLEKLDLGIGIPTATIFFDKNDCTFWLLTIGTTITCYPLIYSDCGRRLLDSYRLAYVGTGGLPTDTVRNRIEGYILAGASIDLDGAFSFGEIPMVSPFAYGWKANWCGDELTIVSNPSEEYDGVASHLRYKGEVYRIEISRAQFSDGEERTRWSATCAKVESVKWVSVPTKNIWAPMYGPERLLGLQTLGVGANQFAFTDAPIYCYYDAQDNLQIARFSSSPDVQTESLSDSRNKVSGAWVTWNNGASYTVSGGTQITGGGSMSVGQLSIDLSYSLFNGFESSGNFSATSPNYSSYGTPHMTEIDGSSVGLGANPSQGSIDAYNNRKIPTGYYYDRAFYAPTSSSYSARQGTRGSSALGAMVIPMDDCEAVYLKVQRHNSFSGTVMDGYIHLYTQPFELWGWTETSSDPIQVELINYGMIYNYTAPEERITSATDGYVTSNDSYTALGANKFGEVAAAQSFPISLLDPSYSYPYSSQVHSTKTSASGLVTGTDLFGSADCSNDKTFCGGI